jgi:hypothetical protein
MKIISFAWTTPAVVARRKTRTRRQWSENYAKTFKANDVCQGYDKNPRIGGQLVHLVRLTRDPWIQNTSEMGDDDFEYEGFCYMEEQRILFRGQPVREFFEEWKVAAEDLYVVDFSYVYDMAYDEGCGYRESHNSAVACGRKTAERPRLPRPLGQMCWGCSLPCARSVVKGAKPVQGRC